MEISSSLDERGSVCSGMYYTSHLRTMLSIVSQVDFCLSSGRICMVLYLLVLILPHLLKFCRDRFWPLVLILWCPSEWNAKEYYLQSYIIRGSHLMCLYLVCNTMKFFIKFEFLWFGLDNNFVNLTKSYY